MVRNGIEKREDTLNCMKKKKKGMKINGRKKKIK